MSNRKSSTSRSFVDHAHTYNMDTRKLREPVVLERSERGREMATSRSMLALDERTETDGTGDTEKFHEGYVDGKLYLVPDSNLEAMKDIINLKMRRQESSKYLDEGDTSDVAQKRYEQKREDLLKKLDRLGLDPDAEEEEEEEEEDETEEEESEEDEAEAKEEEVGEAEEEEESEEDEDEEKKETVEEEEAKEEIEEEEEVEKEPEAEEDLAKESVEEVGTIYPGQFYNPDIQRFLISGHFRTNRKPIYIIQRYAGPSVFGTKDPQFYSQKSDKDADVFIAGEFYKETILVEDEAGRPKRLDTRPRIRVDESSAVHEKEFSDTFVGGGLEVTLAGRFIRQSPSAVREGSALYTPLLTISVRKEPEGALKSDRTEGVPVYVSRPLAQSVFQKDGKKRKQRSKQTQAPPRGSAAAAPLKHPAGRKVKGEALVYTAEPDVKSIFEKEKKGKNTAASPKNTSHSDKQDAPKHRKKPKRSSKSSERRRAGHSPLEPSLPLLTIFSPRTKVADKKCKRDEKHGTIRAAGERDPSGEPRHKVPEGPGRKCPGRSEKPQKVERGERAAGKGQRDRCKRSQFKLSVNSDVPGPLIIDLESKNIDCRGTGKERKGSDDKMCAAGKLLQRLFAK